ncbi:hypothetical protein Gorai_000752, partial [Gossypium raimondii]|nr:hypothetical protein [Gossypium raimondii]
GVGQGAFEVAGERGGCRLNVKYLSDGEGDEELQAARDKLKSFRGKSKPQEAHDEGIREANGHETDYYESDDHGSIVVFSSKDEHEHGARRRRKFPVSRRELKIVKNEPKRIKPINGVHQWVNSGIEPVLPPIDKKMPEK